jgi:putative ubiquitin-RnfH superfamily antitoxin RatB of RatAB toxin-antitoxin module
VSKSDFKLFLEQTIDIIGVDKIALARLDSGFYANDVMNQFESKEIPYIIAAKFTLALVTRVIEKAKWLKAKDRVEYRPLCTKPKDGRRLGAS